MTWSTFVTVLFKLVYTVADWLSMSSVSSVSIITNFSHAYNFNVQDPGWKVKRFYITTWMAEHCFPADLLKTKEESLFLLDTKRWILFVCASSRDVASYMCSLRCSPRYSLVPRVCFGHKMASNRKLSQLSQYTALCRTVKQRPQESGGDGEGDGDAKCRLWNTIQNINTGCWNP